MNLLTTLAGSMMEGFLPRGWDLAKVDACAANGAGVVERRSWWNKDFEPISCRTLEDFDVKLGHEIAMAIKRTHDQGRQVALILPVGPMGMYRWAVYFLREWGTSCDHVHGFNMDEWSDRDGNTLPPANPGAFQNAMQTAFYGPLESKTVPDSQRWFAVPETLPHYAEKIAELKQGGAELIVIFGIGRVCHIAFWEPHFADEYGDRRGVEIADASAGGSPAPAHDRAKRPDQLPQPDHARPGLRQHDRPRPFPPGRPYYRRRRWRFRPGDAMAGAKSVR